MKAELYCHTKLSDASYTFDEILELAIPGASICAAQRMDIIVTLEEVVEHLHNEHELFQQLFGNVYKESPSIIS